MKFTKFSLLFMLLCLPSCGSYTYYWFSQGFEEMKQQTPRLKIDYSFTLDGKISGSPSFEVYEPKFINGIPYSFVTLVKSQPTFWPDVHIVAKKRTKKRIKEDSKKQPVVDTPFRRISFKDVPFILNGDVDTFSLYNGTTYDTLSSYLNGDVIQSPNSKTLEYYLIQNEKKHQVKTSGPIKTPIQEPKDSLIKKNLP